jgi:hypothetical protein
MRARAAAKGTVSGKDLLLTGMQRRRIYQLSRIEGSRTAWVAARRKGLTWSFSRLSPSEAER